MATHQIPILGWNSAPDTTGDVFFETYDIKATNDIFKHMVLVFNNSGNAGDQVYGAFTVPQNYVGSPKFVVIWTSTATAGDVDWHFDYRSVGGDDAESLDQATFQEALTALNETGPSAIDERMVSELTATAANFAAGDTVEYALERDSSNDTKAAAVTVHALLFEYTDA